LSERERTIIEDNDIQVELEDTKNFRNKSKVDSKIVLEK
jgi:hypothetical protein